MTNYKYNAERFSNIDLSQVGCSYPFDWELVDEETIEKMEADGFDRENEWDVSVANIEHYNIPFEAIDYSFGYWEDEEARYWLEDLIKEADHYLVFASGCRWDGASGYKICDDVLDTIARDYDVVIYPRTATRGGKCLVCHEASHDVPMGSTTTIVALTENEYERLKDAEFEAVARFVEKHEPTAA